MKLKMGMGRRGVSKDFLALLSLLLECARVLHESLLVPILIYGNETMI